MAYTATALTLREIVARRSFTALAKAKAWARQQAHEVVIRDDALPSRHIRRTLTNGRPHWIGSAPESWFKG
ncbi:hypothetical protein KIKIMORA_05060 [Brevundimonas phage vB_BpoS-Kikimora]|uniref:Uncharacterized protein n=1 Tax=Brevundimonas phage vB_BpoS-Kikimora TaxID=2948601 RepID=A0A9E7SLK0_9CAUD|nr:hypothetical protein KIKIMORA_05060 [Brevundimonas phage vB_BpoS-Kikimora]